MSGEQYPTTAEAWLAKLIAFNTISSNPNMPLINYVAAYLRTQPGVQVRIIPDPSDPANKANLLATIPAADGSTKGGIVLSGHSDVVPVAGQQWDSDPFIMTERDGKLYGRGTCDMKGFIAVVLALTPTFLQMTRAKPIHYAFSCDEELGCQGVGPFLTSLKQQNFSAECCLVGEPTGMEVYTGNKGAVVWNVSVKGKAIHSSLALMNTSCNAIEHAAAIINKIREIAKKLRAEGPRDDAYECPFCPISTGLIKGGNAVNTVPAECNFTYSLRTHDRSVIKKVEREVQAHIDNVVLPEMRKEYPEASVTITGPPAFLTFEADENDPFTQLARRLRNCDKVCKSGGLTEAGYFVDYLSIPSIVCGPGGVMQAHQPNEYVSREQMAICEKFVTDIVAAKTAGDGKL